jgi:hypothetical protein
VSDVQTAIQKGDADALRRLLAEDRSRSNTLIRWGRKDCTLTHPLHYVSDMLFEGTLEKGKELPLVEALLEFGAAVNVHKPGEGETPLMGAASLDAEDVGLAAHRRRREGRLEVAELRAGSREPRGPVGAPAYGF